MDEIAKKIHALRDRANGGLGISQAALAQKVGTTANTVSRWENGTYKPKVTDLYKIARALNVSVLEFFPDQNTPSVDGLVAFFRARQELDERDVQEIREFTEFRLAKKQLKRVRVGRKSKKNEK